MSTDPDHSAAPAATPTHRSPMSTIPRWVDVVGVALLALVVRLPAYVSSRALSFDDGVFSNSAIAMRNGGIPFRDVFSSQGPLFLPLVYVGDLLGLRTLDAPRTIAVLSGVAAAVAVYWAASQLTDRVGAVLAAALVAVSGGLAWVTGPLAADGPALAFAALTMGLALAQRDRPGAFNAVALGAALGAVLSTKSLEAPVIVPTALVLAAPVLGAARHRRVDRVALGHAAMAVAASVAVFLSVTIPLGFVDVWDQSVLYRTDAAADRDIPATAGKLISTLWDRDLATLFFAAVALVCGVVALRRTGSARVDPIDHDRSWSDHSSGDAPWSPSGRLLAVSWLVTTILWLVVVVSPLWRPHVAAVAIPLSLVIGIYRPPLRICLVAGVVAIPLVIIQLDGLLAPEPYRGTEAELVEQLRGLPDGALVLSDEPGVVWRSGRRTTDDLVDPSMLRREQGRYTEASLAEAAGDREVCAVVTISEQRFAAFDGLPARLEQLGYSAVGEVGDGSVLFLRADCSA